MDKTQPDVIRKLVTIISADVAGYSRLMADDEVETLRVFREHRKVFDSLVQLHRGRIFNTAGDAVLAEFSSAVEAVRCATEIQSALRTANARYPEHRKVQFRIGVNLGDVIEQGTDLLGDGVNVAARLQTAAEPGGVCISGSVYDQIASKLSIEVQSLGEQSYKNIPQPVRTFSVMRADGAARPLPVRPAKKPFEWREWAPYAGGGLALLLLFLIVIRPPAHVVAPMPPPPAEAKPETQPEAAAPLKPMAVPEKIELAAAAAPAIVAKFTVDADYGPGASHRKIAEAIAAAAPGDVIAIRPGVYHERIELGKDVTLRGLPGPDGKVGVRIENTGSETVLVSAGSATLDSVCVVLKADADAKSPSAVLVVGGKVNLHNVAAISAGEHPSIAFSLRSGEAKIETSSFKGSRGIEQLGGSLVCESCLANENLEEGVVVFNQEGSSSFSSHFRNLHADRNGKQGVAVMNGTIASFDGCHIGENGINGADVLGSGAATFTECEVVGNKENGVVAAATARIVFHKGKSSGNRYSGVAAINQSAITITQSELSGNGEFGFATLDKAIAQSEGNTITGNRGGASYRVPASQAPSK